jgi:hypothetical protein
MNITKIALATLILVGTASASLATEFDTNLQNRYPAASSATFQSAPVGLSQGRAYQAPSNFVPAPAVAGGVG